MGVYTSWIAINSDDVTNIHTILELSDLTLIGLSPEQQKAECEKYDAIKAYLLDSGWYVIEAFEVESIVNIYEISQSYDVIAFDYWESAQQSKAQFWCNSILIWEVFHDAFREEKEFEEDGGHLECRGDMPQHFQMVKEKVELRYKEYGCCYTIEIPRLLIEKYLGQEYNEFGRPVAEVAKVCLSLDKPHTLKKKYRIKN